MNADERFYLADTNVLLDDIEIVDTYNIVITSMVLRELEKHKKQRQDEGLRASARHAVRTLLKKRKDGTIKLFDLKDYKFNLNDEDDKDYVDNKIIQACKMSNYGLVTRDGLLLLKAEMYGIPIIELEENTIDTTYAGIKDIYIDEGNLTKEQEMFFLQVQDKSLPYHVNIFDLKLHEYIVLWDLNKPEYNEENELVGYKPFDKPYKWDGEKHTKLKYKKLGLTNFSDEIKPINIKQECMFDMLQNKDIKVKFVTGGYGVGKDYVMLSHAVSMLEDPKNPIKKIVWVRNNIEVKDTKEIGFLPGDKNEKLFEWALVLADKVGGVEGLEYLIKAQKVEIVHIGHLRGRDFKDSILYVTECQNTTKNHVQLMLGRIGEGSELWMNGDLKQSDSDSFRRNSGIMGLKKLAGQPLFGMMTLDKIERSKTAQLAQLLED